MAIFKAHFEESLVLDTTVDMAKALFGDLDAIIAHSPGLEKGEKLDDKTIRFLLKPRRALGVTFQGDYVCEYNFISDSRLEWQTQGSGNVEATGSADFHALGENRSKVTYRQNLNCDIPVNRFVAKAISPIVELSINSGMRDYLKRVKEQARRQPSRDSSRGRAGAR